MKIRSQLAAALAALLMLSNTFPVCAANADRLPETPASSQNNALTSDGAPSEEWATVSSGDSLPSEAPMFSAHIEYFHGQGYVVKGIFTEFLPDTSLVQPLYSLDGETWQTCQNTWNLQWLGRETADDLRQLQNQACLYSTHEPLAGYLAGQLDRFYLKLHITLENGITYETRAAVIDRGDPQPLPEDFTPVADFVPAMRVRQWRPFQSYGQYQITVSADAAPEDISALLPDTLPIEIQLYTGIDFVTNAIVDCPVTWRPLSLSRLTAGESVTIADAADEIIVPAGTLLSTPNGVFQLNEPLGIDHDEIRLILNVIAENAEPTGVLSGYFGGLELSFDLKPTGAAAIRAYTLSDGESTWVEIPDPLLPEEVNAPSSAANSTYTFILKKTSEPYQSYLTSWNAGEEPTPFLVGLKIEGGVYDGKQLILAWPNTYEIPAKPLDLNGSGGNECNAGSNNKNDSTSEGQRPGLPQEPEDVQTHEPPQEPKNEQDVQTHEPPQEPKNEQDAQEPEPPQNLKDEQAPKPPQESEGEQDAQAPQPPQESKDEQDALAPQPFQTLGEEPKDRQAEQLRLLEDSPVGHTAGNPASILTVSTETDSPAEEKTSYGTEHRLHRLPLPAAAAIAIGICITAAVGKIVANSMSGRVPGKIVRAVYRLLHLR